jgi:NAD(P)H-dependent FMN reductase
LKNALDYLYHEWRDKPVGLVSYGGGALGARAIEALKPVLASLRLVYTGELSISLRQFPLVESAFLGDDVLASRAKGLLDELKFVTPSWMALRLKRDESSH